MYTRKTLKKVNTLTNIAKVFGVVLHVGGFLNITNTHNRGWFVRPFFRGTTLLTVITLEH